VFLLMPAGLMLSMLCLVTFSERCIALRQAGDQLPDGCFLSRAHAIHRRDPLRLPVPQCYSSAHSSRSLYAQGQCVLHGRKQQPLQSMGWAG